MVVVCRSPFAGTQITGAKRPRWRCREWGKSETSQVNAKPDRKKRLQIRSPRNSRGLYRPGDRLRGASASANRLRILLYKRPIRGFVRHKRGLCAANAPCRCRRGGARRSRAGVCLGSRILGLEPRLGLDRRQVGNPAASRGGLGARALGKSWKGLCLEQRSLALKSGIIFSDQNNLTIRTTGEAYENQAEQERV